MKIKKVGSDKIYLIDLQKQGENQMPCPECSLDRRKKSAKCFSFNAEKGQGYCNHCDSRFYEYKPFDNVVIYAKPVTGNFTELSQKALNYSTDRHITQEVLNRMQIKSVEEFMPQTNKKENCIAFPYIRDGEIVNVKYRDGRKNFKLTKDAELLWYNFDALKENKEIIIVEGEWDALSFMVDGFYNTISVPNGANVGQMTYLDNSISLFDSVEKVYIATDNDDKGIQLRDELIRRLGFEKCYIVNFSEFKDANDYLKANSYGSLKKCIEGAKMPKIEGILEADDYLPEIINLWENGMQKGKELNVRWLDEFITWETKRLCTISGTPSSGKSELIDFINCKLNINYGWKCAYWTPENYPTQYHYSKLAEKLTGKQFKKEYLDEADFWECKDYIEKNFFWVALDNDYTIDNILEKFRYLVKTKGVKVCVIDPFNKLEYRLDKGDTKLDYISKLLDKLIWFAKTNDVLIHLVAHPKKLEKDRDGKFPMPTMYDISGSADFWNKTDYGICVKRTQDNVNAFVNKGEVAIQKVKFKHLGSQGVSNWTYNWKNGRYEDDYYPKDFEVTEMSSWDNFNWIKKLNNPFYD